MKWVGQKKWRQMRQVMRGIHFRGAVKSEDLSTSLRLGKVRAVVIHSAESVRSGCLQKVITRISLSVEWSWSYKPD